MTIKATTGDCCNESTPLDLGLKPIESCGSSSNSGNTGGNGQSAYQIAVANGFVGTESQWLESLQGVDGKTAYELAVEGGFVGNEAAWLASLEGVDGDSAYQIWLDAGNTGTEEDFLAALSAEGKITENWIANTQAGAIAPGDTDFIDKTLTQFAKMLTLKTYFPAFIAETYSMSNNAGGVRKIGDVIPSLALTLTLNRGSILGTVSSGIWNPAGVQNPRSGIATNYRFIGLGSPDINQGGATYNKVNHTVVQGDNTFTGDITYAAGPQPKDSDNANYGPPLAGGTSPVQTTKFEGVYPLFASTQAIATATEQTLISMVTSNNVQLTLVAETPGNKQFIDIPQPWLDDRPITDIQYYNVVSGQFDIVGKLGDFTQTVIVKSINSANVNYKRLSYNKSDRGSQLLRLVF